MVLVMFLANFKNVHRASFFIFVDFSRESGGTLPQNSYKPSCDLWESTLLRRTRSIQLLARSFGTNTQTHKYTNILLLYYKDKVILNLKTPEITGLNGLHFSVKFLKALQKSYIKITIILRAAWLLGVPVWPAQQPGGEAQYYRSRQRAGDNDHLHLQGESQWTVQKRHF